MTINQKSILAITHRINSVKAELKPPLKPIKLKAAVVFQGAEEWSTFTTLAKTFDALTTSDAGTSAMKNTYTTAAEMAKDVKEVVKFFGGDCYSEVGKKLLDHFTESLEDQVANFGFPAK